ncbi:MAG: flagellar hook-basal body complex protein, partial [Phycisphaerae bacterium]|nr:flagellar hook-basal body complex protein [Phycisphaerae bacterium]
IANVNTYGFKSSRASFQTQFTHTLQFGTAPVGNSGGTNPMQVGTGVQVGAVAMDFTGGAPETTGRKNDLAIQGQGLFILKKADGGQVYSRDGSFQFNSENYLLSADGNFLQGYPVDANFNIVEGTMENMRIPLGEITTAQTSSYAHFSGDLKADGDGAFLADGITVNPEIGGSPRSRVTSQTLTDGGGNLTDTTLLVNVDNGGSALVLDGNVITLADAIKGAKTLPQTTFDVTATSTLGEYMTWLQGALGINTSSELTDRDGDAVVDADAPGVRISATNDSIEIFGNIGDMNTIDMQGSKALVVTQGTGAGLPVSGPQPFSFITPNGHAQGSVESVRTSFLGYDSLGTPINIDVTLAMESKSDNGIQWRYFAESGDDTDVGDYTTAEGRVLGTGTVTFDPNGNFLQMTNPTITIDRQGTGAGSPQTITLNFENMDGFTMSDSVISLLKQDGFQAGTLQDYSISSNGLITGSFTNGLTRNLGQVVLATFRNYEGLVADSDNVFKSGPNSGQPIIKRPQELGTGAINSTALELSNVDLSREFINLIVSSTGFSASSRVIQTSDQLLNELMALTR